MGRSENHMNNRLGIHYFPDTKHYREHDASKWIPELMDLGLSWLVLITPSKRAIPENFLSRLIKSSVTPILHFNLPVEPNVELDSIDLFFKTYARWGVKYVCLFDRPNLRKSWPSNSWTQRNLVDQFLDIYIPLANRLLEYDLIPVFPPLEPGGDYWDTSFLRLALRSLRRRGKTKLLDSLVIGAYAWLNNHPLNWGAGGPENWPGAKPYKNSTGTQDQMGFRIFDWYSIIARAELGQPRPIILMKVGERAADPDPRENYSTNHRKYTDKLFEISQIMAGRTETNILTDQTSENKVEFISSKFNDLVPNEVIACNYWLLGTDKNSPHTDESWYKSDGNQMPIVSALKNHHQLLNSRNQREYIQEVNQNIESRKKSTPKGTSVRFNSRPIRHYFLILLYGWGVAEWDMDFIHPYIQRFHPTVGFSLDEALLSKKVTLVGNLDGLPKGALDQLRAAGCKVEHLANDGTILAI
jgi:hypothetical protein